MISIKINDFEFLVKPNISILDACKYAGINVPRFCYHETLSVSGNCRMCLVEIEGMEKPLASCVAEVDEGMSIWVDTPFVKKARENVIETLLLNHPLDCPICDQAGECDLQDQTKTYGSTYSRFFFEKTSVEDKIFNPLIKPIMTRCITCTRCVRYATEIAGIEFFGTLNRGGGTEIGSYVTKIFDSEISGNVIDLCPVGALTSKPYAFKARPWELRLVESIDTTDSLGSNIYINYKETEIVRVLPKNNSDLNGSLISDKARFSYDANKLNRLSSKYKYSLITKQLEKISWVNLFEKTDTILNTNFLDIVIDEKCDFETALQLKKLSNKYPEKINIFLNSKTCLKNNLYISYKKDCINNLLYTEDLFILLGSNLRLENAILNARIRFKFKNSLVNTQSMGLHFDENIPTSFVNLNLSKILNVFEGKSYLISKNFIFSKNPYVFIGESFTNRIDNVNNFINKILQFLPTINIINLNNSNNSEGVSFLNFLEISSKIKNTTIAVNLEDNTINRRFFLNKKNNFIWFNSHGSYLATKFDTIVPTLTPFETEQVYFNLESRPQKTQKFSSFSSDVKSTLQLLISFFNLKYTYFFKNTCFSFIEEILTNSEKFSVNKNQNIKYSFIKYTNSCLISSYPIKLINKDFYSCDSFTRNSLIMQECSSNISKKFINFYKKT